jgi:hypothetical protein
VVQTLGRARREGMIGSLGQLVSPGQCGAQGRCRSRVKRVCESDCVMLHCSEIVCETVFQTLGRAFTRRHDRLS